MNNIQTMKAKAWGKVQLFMMLIVCLAVLGAVREYLHITAPADKAMLVYHFGDGNAQPQPVEEVTPQPVEETAPEPASQPVEEPAPMPEPVEEAAPVSEPTPQPEENHSQGAQEFLDYMYQTQSMAAGVTFDGTFLDKINLREVAVEQQPAQPEAVEETPSEPVSEQSVSEEINDAEAVEKAKTDVMANVLENVDKIVADSEALQAEQNADEAAIAEVINQEEQAQEAMREQISQEIGEIEAGDENAPIVLLPGVLDKQE